MTGGLVGQRDADRDRAEGAHQELALGADVEQAGLEAERDRQAAEDQRRRCDQRADDRRRAADSEPSSRAPVGDERQRRVELRWSGTSELGADDDRRRRRRSARTIEIERQAGDRPERGRGGGHGSPRRRSGRSAARHGAGAAAVGRDRAARVAASCAAGRHQQADLVLVGRPAVDDRHDLAAVHDRDPVGQLEDLVELGRDEQDGRPGVALARSPGGG